MLDAVGLQRDELQLSLLVLRCQAGDEAAFATLFVAFGQRTLRYLRGLVGEDADDVQQEVWLRVFRGVAELGDPGRFRTWLFTITRHKAIDLLRKRRREHDLFEETSVEVEAEMAEMPEDPPWTASEPTMTATLAKLTAAQREVLVLRYNDELSYGEIAVITGCLVGTVRSRLHYAKQRLQRLIGPTSQQSTTQHHHSRTRDEP